MASKQLKLLEKKEPIDHGMGARRGKRKEKRPFSPKAGMHLILRSERAWGDWNLLRPKHAGWIREFIFKIARKRFVRIHEYANVGNHIHMLVDAKDHEHFKAFLRLIAGQIAFRVTGAKKTNPQGRFWSGLAYSRLVTWGREFEAVKTYLRKNMFEAAGFWSRKKFPDLRLITVEIDGAVRASAPG